MKILRALIVTIGITLCFISLGCGTTTAVQATVQTGPSISQVIPQSIPVGSGNVTMQVMGANFTSQTVVLWNGSQLATSMIDSNTLAASVQGGSFAVPGTAHVQVQNSQTGQESGSLSVVIASSGTSAAPLGISTTSLASGVAGTSYSVSLAATGGTAAYTWSISSGQLPSGLSLAASTGIISGTPTTSGTFSFGVTVIDSGSPQQSATATLALSIGAGVQKPATLVLGSAALPNATATQSYSGPLSATGGTAPYLWTVSSGQLPSGLAIASSTGVISGAPTTSGTFSFTVTVTDSGSPVQTASASTSIVVVPTTLGIISSTLASGTNGTAYSQTLQASGGTPGYTWSIASGSLPTGLTLGPTNGVISGAPTVSGTFAFTVAVTDSGSPAQTKTAATSIVIAPTTLAITSTTLSTGTAGAAYSQSLQASGGTPGYTWSITSGSLPAGLSLASSSGVISGTPATSGTSNFTVTVTDSGNPAQTKSSATSIVVGGTVLAITSSTLSGGTNGTAYSQTLQASGGTPGYTWSITAGTLPTGLTLASSSGVISGTPIASGTSNFTVTVTDSGNPAQTKSAATSIVVGGTVLAITTSTLPSGTNGTAYSQTLLASGGTPGYTWSITAGTLPTGLTLASASGTISGTPTTTGTSNFTVTAADNSKPAAQTKSAALTIVVAAKPLTMTTSTLPSGTNGTAYSQSLQASGGTPAYSWSITSGSLPAGLTLASATGAISGTPTASGTANFTVTVSDSGNPAQTKSTAMSIVIAATTLAITSPTLAAGTNGTAYSQTLQASGGTPAYSWSISSGSLPAGLTLASATGTISGTPTAIGIATFTVTVSDGGNPVQTKSVATTIVVAPGLLAILASALPSATSGTSYSTALQASGGTPAYTWSITSGSLPTGLTEGATTGIISGTPTVSGTFNFTATVSDNGTPVQTKSVATSIVVNVAVPTGPGTTWYVRTDGGTRYSGNVPTGQCDGKADTAYPGSGTNQHCAFNDVRYTWMDGTYGNSAWVIAGGDTVVIRGCAALPSQQNSDAPHCRIGWDKGSGNDAQNFWCAGVSAFWGCAMPPPPSGTASQHTKILGGCAYGTYTCNPVIGYPYTGNNLAQLFGGFNSGAVIYMNGSQYVDVEGLEITSHNGQCTRVGGSGQQYPMGCSTSPPTSDYANWGIITSNTTSNITLQDVYIHGLTTEGIGGPIGGPFTLTRVSIDFNAFAGWNFDDGVPTPDAPGSSITQSYVTMVGNGCLEQYPIVNPQFPALSCWDSGSGGFGDSWSGQATSLDSFSCDHCNISYNAKDGAMGPHTLIHNISLTNSVWIGNMGQSGKWGQDANSTFLFQNNLMVGNCMRMSAQLPGAAQNFNIGTGLGGSYLTTFCRAAGPLFDYFADAGSTVNFDNNTIVTYQPTTFEPGCNTLNNCANAPYNFTNNIILGYTSSASYYPNTGQAPGLFYLDDNSVNIVSKNNIEYGVRNGDCPSGGTAIICSDPLFVNEPAQGSWPAESVLDNFNFHLTSGSPAVHAGVGYSGAPAADYYGNPQSSPLTIGAVAP